MVVDGLRHEGLLPGFADTVLESQATFRAVLGAMARPGIIHDLAPALEVPAPSVPESMAVCLSLLDVDTAIWLDQAARRSDDLKRFLAFHCGCPFVPGPDAAAFALITDPSDMPPLSNFKQGTAEYPDRSTTVILQVEAMDGTKGVTLRGPGIEESHLFDAIGLAGDFWSQVRENRSRFPLGVDLIFVAPGRLAALPRSTHVELT